MSLQDTFIKNLRTIRRKKKITQEKLAELCQTETSYIGQIEIGRRFPSIPLIEKIAFALDIPAYMLFKDYEALETISEKEIKELSDKIVSFTIKELQKHINNI